MLYKIVLIALAGGAGSVARYGLGAGVQRLTGSEFPWGTLAVNLVGCLLFGVISGVAEHRLPLSEETKLVLLVGFMGAFTTFSTFAFHSGLFLDEQQWGAFAANVLANNVGGITLFLLGFYLTRIA